MPTNKDLTLSGDRLPRSPRSEAAAPEVTAADMDVPLPLKYLSATTESGFSTKAAEPGAASETSDTPGAEKSGRINPKALP